MKYGSITLSITSVDQSYIENHIEVKIISPVSNTAQGAYS
jgi:hypothetical protein